MGYDTTPLLPNVQRRKFTQPLAIVATLAIFAMCALFVGTNQVAVV
eukprot:SAG11_NODE_30207_length_303_cov_0.750000_1_plen_45_part_10